MVQLQILFRHMQIPERLFRLGEIILGREAAAGAVFLPLMLDQSAAGHVVEHVVNRVGRHRRGV